MTGGKGVPIRTDDMRSDTTGMRLLFSHQLLGRDVPDFDGGAPGGEGELIGGGVKCQGMDTPINRKLGEFRFLTDIP